MQSRKKPVVVIGSINIDLVANSKRIPVAGETIEGGHFQVYPGGKGANQAVAAARLGYPVHVIGKLGDDVFGAQLRAHLEASGVNVAGVSTVSGSSGVALIVVAENGDNSIVITPGANALLSPQDIDANLGCIRSAGIVLTQLEIPMPTVQHLAEVCARENVPLILDPAPAKELPEGILEAVTWLTPNETEAAFLGGTDDGGIDVNDPGEIATMLIKKGTKGVVIKLGSRGVYLASASGLKQMLRAFPVNAVDTTAAGDAFNGSFAVALLMGMESVESARFAAAAAAVSVTRAGAQPSMPTLSDVEQMLKNMDQTATAELEK